MWKGDSYTGSCGVVASLCSHPVPQLDGFQLTVVGPLFLSSDLEIVP